MKFPDWDAPVWVVLIVWIIATIATVVAYGAAKIFVPLIIGAFLFCWTWDDHRKDT